MYKRLCSLVRSRNAKTAAIFVGGDTLNKSIPFLLLPLIVYKTTAYEFGLYSLGVLFLQFSQAFCLSGMSAKVILVTTKKQPFEPVLGAGLIIAVFALLLLIVLFNGFSGLEIFSGFEWSSVFFLVLAGFCNALVALFMSVYQARLNAFKYALLQLAQTTSFFLSVVIGILLFSLDAVWKLIFVSSLLSLIAHLYLIFKESLEYQIAFSRMLENMRFAMAQLPHVMSSWVRLGYDRMVLASLVSIAAVGGYSAALQVGLVVSVIVMGMNKFMSPKILTSLFEGRSVRPYIYYSVAGLFLLFFMVTTLGVLLFYYFFPVEYVEYVYLIPIFGLAYSFQGLYFLVINFLHFYEKSHFIFIPSVSSLVVHVFVAPILIAEYGVEGGAFALLISWFLLFVFTLGLVLFMSKRLK